MNKKKCQNVILFKFKSIRSFLIKILFNCIKYNEKNEVAS